MTESGSAGRLLFACVARLADRTPVEVELIMLNELIPSPPMNTAAGTPDRLSADKGQGPCSIIGRPCQEGGVGDSSTGCVVDAFPVESVPILIPLLVKGMSTISLLAVTAAIMISIVSDSDHSFQIR